MSFREDINKFRDWATNLGFRPEDLPNEDALISIFKSRQRDLFIQLQKRVLPRQDVQAARENILIQKMKELQNEMVPSSHRSFLPTEMRTHLEMQELKIKRESAVATLEESRKQFDSLAASIKMTNTQCANTTHKKRLLTAKCNILELKSEQLKNSIAQAEDNQKKILATIPVKLTTENASEEQAMKAVEKALAELAQFYAQCNNVENGNQTGQTLRELKAQLWQKMREIFGDVPNYLIFNAIKKLKDDQLQHIMQLNQSHERQHTESQGRRRALNSFQVKLLKANADVLGLVAKYIKVCNEGTALDERFAHAYCTFVDDLLRRVNLFNAIDDVERTEKLVFDFIVQYNMTNFNIARNNFLRQQIKQYSLQVESNAKQLKSHEILLGSVKQAYGDINASVNRIQYDMLQLTHIKDKMLYTKDMLRRALSGIQATVAMNANYAKTNFNSFCVSHLGTNSFDSESVLCSTKLDFDDSRSSLDDSTARGSFNRADKILVPTAATMPPTLPNHLLELNTFIEVPLEKLSCVPPICAFYLAANPLIVESEELASIVHLVPGLLLTPFGALQEVSCQILWASSIAAHTQDLKFDCNIVNVNVNELKAKSEKQNERLSQLLGSIEATTKKTAKMLQKAERIHDFVKDNRMRDCIPSTATFKSFTYADYESEFNLYYRMATGGDSIK